MSNTLPGSSPEEPLTVPRWLAWATLLVVVGVALWGFTLAASADAWEFPNGSDLAPSRAVERPDGAFEVFPARCTVFEDGSARCGSWDEGTESPEVAAVPGTLEAHRQTMAALFEVIDRLDYVTARLAVIEARS